MIDVIHLAQPKGLLVCLRSIQVHLLEDVLSLKRDHSGFVLQYVDSWKELQL